jgi:PadR family transcriptional regulator PadR
MKSPGLDKSDLLQGTLDMLVLKVLDLGPMHGYGIAQRLEQISQAVLQVNQGSLYPALLRLEQQGWISSQWGASENNRRARFYALTRAGRRQLAAETVRWERVSGAIGRLLRAVPG